jgi:ABC-type bacteriocin/lantibiotic exporter with double-glycine peptidase domain
MILQVPYKSQHGGWNLCGEACAVMMGAYFGKDFTNSEMEAAMQRYGLCDTLAQLKDGLAYFGIPVYVNNYLPLPNLTECIREGKPVICLINYGKVPKYAKLDQTYTGGHFVLVIGVDGSVHYHDPLGRADQTVTHEEWNSFYLNQALVPELSKETEMSEETALRIAAALEMANKMYRVQNAIKFVQPNPADPTCFVSKTKRLAAVNEDEMKSAGFTFADLNK